MPSADIKKYLKSLEFDKVLALISSHTKTDIGKEYIESLIPCNLKSEIEYQLNLTTEAKEILDFEGTNSLPLYHATDPNKILNTSRLGINDIIDLTKMLTTSRKLKTYLTKNSDKINLYNTYNDKLISDKELEDKIYSVFDDNFNIKDSASAELKRLRNSLASTNENLKNAINSLLKDPDFTIHLQDTICTERMGRTVFQVKASDKSKIKGIVHDVSSTNQTYFIEPEILVGINNKIRQIECEIEAEIERILYKISAEFHNIKNELIQSYFAIGEIDSIFAKAKYSIMTKSNPANITDKKIIKLYSMYHPLLFGKENLVKNDFKIGEDYISLLITGSNTGGKTVTLKTAGLLVLMTKAGLHIPCDYAEIYPFKNVYSDIEENQDISQSLSTFSAHTKNIAHIMDIIKEDDLVLFDELMAGTDPVEGASLARAILEYLAEKNIITITTTHLGELKILEYQNDKFKNASVEFDTKTLKPAYKLIIGLAGSSYAIDIAKNLNLKEEIINKAKEFLDNNTNPDNKIFGKIRQTHQELMEHTKKIEQSKITTEKIEEELNEKLKEIKEKKKKTLESFKKKYQSSLESAREEIKQTLDELRKEKSEKIARRSYSRLAKLESQIREEFTKDEDELSNKYPPLDWNEIKLGQSVLVIGINQPAILKSYPDDKGMVEIQMGLIKSKIHKSKLAKTDRKVSKGIKKLTVSFDDFHNSLSFAPRLDLRGMRVDEAIDTLEHHLDLAVMRNIHSFTVIHGHGTGALKNAIRNYLNDSPYVLKYRTGDDTEGGDGVCIIDVK